MKERRKYPIEGFPRQIRRYSKTKGSFTRENASFKQVFCAIKQIPTKWNMPVQIGHWQYPG